MILCKGKFVFAERSWPQDLLGNGRARTLMPGGGGERRKF